MQIVNIGKIGWFGAKTLSCQLVCAAANFWNSVFVCLWTIKNEKLFNCTISTLIARDKRWQNGSIAIQYLHNGVLMVSSVYSYGIVKKKIASFLYDLCHTQFIWCVKIWLFHADTPTNVQFPNICLGVCFRFECLLIRHTHSNAMQPIQFTGARAHCTVLPCRVIIDVVADYCRWHGFFYL